MCTTLIGVNSVVYTLILDHVTIFSKMLMMYTKSNYKKSALYLFCMPVSIAYAEILFSTLMSSCLILNVIY